MGFLDKYPYTDFHELNLDWFLAEFKKVMDTTATLEQTVQQFTDFVTNYFDNLDIQTEVNNKLNQMASDGTLAALIGPLLTPFESDVYSRIGTQNSRISSLETRMDTFASLPPGSTAGNAELLDIRIAKGGIEFASAGNAVRQQFPLVDNGKINLLALGTAYKGYFTGTGVNPGYTPGWQSAADWGFIVIPVRKGMQITISGLSSSSGAQSAWLSSSNPTDFVATMAGTANTDGTYTCKSDWLAITMFTPSNYIDTGKVTFDVYRSAMKVGAVPIQANNYAELLPDINNITENITYKLNYGGGDSSLPANMPFAATPYGDIFVLVTYANTSSGSNATAQQYLYGRSGDVWYRNKGTNWNAWQKNDGKGCYITVGASGCDYTAIVPAVIQASKTPNSRVYVKDGTYDFISEFTTYISGTFFSSYTTGQAYGTGLHLYNGITIEMSANAKIVANYTGGNASVRSNWAPFVSNYGDFTLINVTIEASNVRYCVHDDQISKNMGPCKHRMIGCHFTLDNRGLAGSPDTIACIGGGLDIGTTIEIEDCYIESLGSAAHDIMSNPTMSCASYHNSNLANAKSNVFIKNTYCKYGTWSFGKYGPTTRNTQVQLSGCRMKSEPYTYYEDPDNYTVDNIELRKWSNTIE